MVSHGALRLALSVISLILVKSLLQKCSLNSKPFSGIQLSVRGTVTRLQLAEESPSSTVNIRNEEEVRAAMKLDREVVNPESVLAAKKSEMQTAQLFDAASLDATFLQSLTAKRS